jgi:pimeloyl-ACP methyl ester carboxylesterase
MSQTTPPPSPGPRPKGTGSAVLVGLLVGVLIVAVGVGGVVAFKKSSDGTTASGPAGTATPSPTAPASSGSPSAAPSTGSPTDLKAFYAQRLAWHTCGSNQCATLKVPLDYAHPGAHSIDIAVLKVAAHDKAHRLGSLVVNPGGPGGSGVDYAASADMSFGTVLPKYYDLVGFDPRGVGRSTPLHCVDTKQLDTLIASDPDPDTAAERNRMDALVHNFGEGCLSKGGDLARHMSTVEAAKDMDILRAALGEQKMDYFGASYGTFLGATYANLFPKRVHRMVLDGAIDPALSNAQLSLAQAHGFETALRAYVADCVRQGGCFLGSSVDAGTKRIRAFLDQIEKQPLPTGTSRKLTAGLGMVGIWLPLYVKSYWPDLTAALQAAMNHNDGSPLLGLADAYTSRGPHSYRDNSFEALYAVNCLDHDDYIATSQVPSHLAAFLKASPTFGKAFAFGLSTCSTWPVRSGQHTVALHAKGAPPIVVIGTTRDPATPLAWAKALAGELDSGVLVTRNGDGHTAFNRGNSCVDSSVQNYFVQGTVPQNGLAC